MSGFIAIAVLLSLAVLASVLYPLLRRPTESPASWISSAVVFVLLVAGSVAFYPLWSNFDWSKPEPTADSPESMVGRLARRLEKEPEDLQGWLMLGRSYLVLEERSTPGNERRFAALAVRAYTQADKLARGRNADALMGLAEAMILAGRSDLGGRAGRLFEQALELDPRQTKAVFYSALAAAERKEFVLARQRFRRLLDSNPPEDVRRILEQQMQALDGMQAMTGMAAMAAAAPDAAATAAGGQPAAAAGAASVPLRITLAPDLAARIRSGTRLFISARSPGQRGPPLAAKVLEARFPQDVELQNSDAMIGGTGFAAGEELEIQAHVGAAISASGDPIGTVRVKAGGKTRTPLTITQLKP